MLKELINKYHRVTVLFSFSFDEDSTGVALAIYNILKNYKKSVEIVSYNKKDIPIYLDFLPNFSKIKDKIDFDNSLIIYCDKRCVNLFNLNNREILNLDFYKKSQNYTSMWEIAFKLFKSDFVIDRNSATCFYTSFLLDIKYFKTNSLTKEVFDVSSDIIADDIDISEISYNLNQRKSLSSLRILGSTLQELTLHCNGEVSIMIVTKENIKKSGAKYSDLLEVVNYGISLVTVKISIVLIELDNSIYIYLRGKKDIDVLSLALNYGGSGEKMASYFEIKIDNIEVFLKDLINNIKEMELLNEIQTK